MKTALLFLVLARGIDAAVYVYTVATDGTNSEHAMITHASDTATSTTTSTTRTSTTQATMDKVTISTTGLTATINANDWSVPWYEVAFDGSTTAKVNNPGLDDQTPIAPWADDAAMQTDVWDNHTGGTATCLGAAKTNIKSAQKIQYDTTPSVFFWAAKTYDKPEMTCYVEATNTNGWYCLDSVAADPMGTTMAVGAVGAADTPGSMFYCKTSGYSAPDDYVVFSDYGYQWHSSITSSTIEAGNAKLGSSLWSGTDAYAKELLPVLVHRAKTFHAAKGAWSTILSENTVRKEDGLYKRNRLFVAFRFFAFCMLGSCAFWMAWILPPGNCISAFNKFGGWLNYAFWGILLLGPSIGVLYVGFVASLIWLLILIILCVIVIPIYVFQGCCCCKCKCLVGADPGDKDWDPEDNDPAAHEPGEGRKKWSFMARPKNFSVIQLLIVLCSVVCGIILAGFMGGYFGAWTVPAYKLWDEQTGTTIEEFAPQNIVKGQMLLYSKHGFAGKVSPMDKKMMSAITGKCGTVMSQTLEADEKEAKLYTAYIEKYSIDMSIYSKPDYNVYTTVNDWFSRRIYFGVLDGTAGRLPTGGRYRPIYNCVSSKDLGVVGCEEAAGDTTQCSIVHASDSRVVVYPNMAADHTIWIKDEDFTMSKLINTAAAATPAILAPLEVAGAASLVIWRLAPQDYHCFHSSVRGEIKAIYDGGEKGNLQSVSSDAMTSGSGAIHNERKILIIDTDVTNGSQIGVVAYIAIGAACVGSIKLKTLDANMAELSAGTVLAVGMTVKRGQLLGCMAFGGSTVAMVVESSKMQFNYNYQYASQFPVENLVEVRASLGVATAQCSTFA